MYKMYWKQKQSNVISTNSRRTYFSGKKVDEMLYLSLFKKWRTSPDTSL